MKKFLLLSLGALMFTSVATVGHCDPEKNEAKFKQRYEQQIERCEKGLNEGQINPKEKDELAKRLNSIRHDYEQNVAKHGHLTDKMADELNERQDKLSEDIKRARDSHH